MIMPLAFTTQKTCLHVEKILKSHITNIFTFIMQNSTQYVFNHLMTTDTSNDNNRVRYLLMTYSSTKYYNKNTEACQELKKYTFMKEQKIIQRLT